MPAVIAAYSIYLLVGVVTMDVGEVEFPGPQFFPTLLAIAGLVLAVILALNVLRSPEHPTHTHTTDTAERSRRTERPWRFYSDFAALAWTAGGFLAFALLLPWLGWILAGALLFWFVAHGFGSLRPVFDIVVALFISSVVYLAFDAGFGLNLPSGILGGGF